MARARLARGGDAMSSVGLSPSTRRPFGYPSNKHKLELPPGPQPPANLSSRSTEHHTKHRDTHKIAVGYTTEGIRSSRFATKLHILRLREWRIWDYNIHASGRQQGDKSAVAHA